MATLASGGSALDAAVDAVVVLEDDPRMNAGTGSTLRLDGSTQLDAAVVDADGFGGVAAVEGLANPVRLARHVHGLPHVLIVGDGASNLGRRLGLSAARPPPSGARERHDERMRRLGMDPLSRAFWQGVELQRLVGADGCDTVGAVVRDGQGRFAAAGSTGGLWCALRGRVGDVAIPGAGLYVGHAGAVAATGVGELIWHEMLARRVHDRMGDGLPAQAAVDEALHRLDALHPGLDVGLIAVDAHGSGGGCTREMPWASLVSD